MRINKILLITLSNIGDVILTLPVLDYLRARFPDARITVMAGERPKEIFEDNPAVNNLIVYDKRSKLKEKIKLFQELKRQRFDLAVDLRNTFFGAFIPAKYRNRRPLITPRDIRHMKDRHMHRLMASIPLPERDKGIMPRNSLNIAPRDDAYIKNILEKNNIGPEDKFAIIAPGARSHIKRWPADKFIDLIPALAKETGLKIILAGDREDAHITGYIAGRARLPVLDLAGKTNIAELACLLRKARILITNDSAILHLAGYLNVPAAAIFGPTDEIKYGPWPQTSAIVKKEIFCRPCGKAQCRFNTLECMQLIKVEDVMRGIRDALTANPRPTTANPKVFKRILVMRIDRLGDVLLSTPVIKALRDKFPHAFIAMMVCPYAKEAIEGNPFLDQVISYDKEGKHKSWRRSIKFARRLKKKKFDLAIILHPANRAHLIAYLAGIPKRVGYDKKLGFLLTDRIKHTKQFGRKHELEYNLDLLRYLGIEPVDKKLFMPIKPESEKWVEQLFEREGIKNNDRLLIINPGASCPSKIWPNERFAQVADRLTEKYGFKALIVSGAKETALAASLVKRMRNPAIDLGGKTSVSQLASLLQRGSLFISNDTGPVHIACALGTPAISIFGRSQAGLSPKRWGPVGEKSIYLHKEVGCIECFAHNCAREFACLKAITADDVITAADSMIKG